MGLLIAVDDGFDLVHGARAGGGVEAEDEGGPADVVAAEAVGGLVASDEAEAEALEEEGKFSGRAFAEETAVGIARIGVDGAALGDREDERAAGGEHLADLAGEFEEVGVGQVHDHGEGEDGVKAVREERMAGGKGKSGLQELDHGSVRARGIGIGGEGGAGSVPGLVEHRRTRVRSDNGKAVFREKDGIAAGAAADLEEAAAGRQVRQQQTMERRDIGGGVAAGEVRGAGVIGVEGGRVHGREKLKC